MCSNLRDLGGDLAAVARETEATLYRLSAQAARYGGDVPLPLANELREAERRHADAKGALESVPAALRQFCEAITHDPGLSALHRHAIDMVAEAVDRRPPSPPPADPSGLLRPEFSLLRREAVGERPKIRREPVADLAAALDGAERIVLRAPPGAGKTVALKRLVYDVAVAQVTSEHVMCVPLLLELGSWASGRPLAEWAASIISDRWNAPLVAQHLGRLLADGRVLLVLDAINELPLVEDPGSLDRLSRFLAIVPEGNRVILSCRPWDELPKRLDYQQVELAPLTPDRIRLLLQSHLGADRAGEIWRQIDGTLLADLVAIPYFAVMLAVVVVERGELPRNQGALIGQFVAALVARESNHSALQSAPASALIAALRTLAFHVHREVGPSSTVTIPWAEHRVPAEVVVEGRAWQLRSQLVLRFAADVNLANIAERWSGFRFAHQLLAEWLAGQELASRLIAGLPDRPALSVPLRRDEISAVTTRSSWRVSLPPPPPTGWELATVLASGAASDASELIERVMNENVLLAGQCLIDGANVDETVRRSVVARLVDLAAAPDASVRARMGAGDILGTLGDPRLEQPPIEIPAGSFLMGDDGVDSYGQLTTRHCVYVEAFAMDRCAVTMTEYARFVADGGYERSELWCESGWRWRTARGIAGPAFPETSQATSPSSPQVGISWYEAAAYASWRGGRLPTEAEWEKAAACVPGTAESRVYPWGDEFDPDRLNCRESSEQAGRPTPVGIYPAGASAFGVLDMAGNVWEWCSSAYAPYPYREDDGRESPERERNRVMRGGTFWSTRGFVRCASRFRTFPRYRLDVAGVRIAYDRSSSRSI